MPKKLTKTEQKITSLILPKLFEYGPPVFAAEIKATRGNTIPKSALQPHQRLALLAASGPGLIHKLSDEARRKQPFDAFKMAYAKGYVVACFVGPGERVALMIDVRQWQGARRDTPCAYRIEL